MNESTFKCFKCLKEDDTKNEKNLELNINPDKNEYQKIIRNIILNEDNQLKDNDYICIDCIKNIYEEINKKLEYQKLKNNEKENALKYLIIELEKQNILDKEKEFSTEIEKLKKENKELENKIKELKKNKNNLN